jgi:hypothetical protein
MGKLVKIMDRFKKYDNEENKAAGWIVYNLKQM